MGQDLHVGEVNSIVGLSVDGRISREASNRLLVEETSLRYLPSHSRSKCRLEKAPREAQD